VKPCPSYWLCSPNILNSLALVYLPNVNGRWVSALHGVPVNLPAYAGTSTAWWCRQVCVNDFPWSQWLEVVSVISCANTFHPRAAEPWWLPVFFLENGKPDKSWNSKRSGRRRKTRRRGKSPGSSCRGKVVFSIFPPFICVIFCKILVLQSTLRCTHVLY